MDKMLSRTGRFPCGCCWDNTPKKDKRAKKRRERQAWKKEVRRG